MKTKLTLLSAALACAVFASCGKQDTPNPKPQPNPDPTPEAGTKISDVLSGTVGSEFEVEGALVVGANTNGVLLGQEDSYIYAFPGEEHSLSVGDVVTVKGTTASRNSLLQFDKGCELTKTGTKEVSFPEAEEFDAAAIEAYMQTPAVKYITVKGTVLLSGNYTNLEMEGTSVVGSLDYMTDDFKKSYAGHDVTVTGWAFGAYKTYLYIIPVSVEDRGMYEEEVPQGAIYYNTFDKEVVTMTYGDDGKSWPFLDQFDGWQNQKGSGVAGVSYEYQKMSCRGNQSSKGNLSEYEGSGKNNIFFSTAPNYFIIKDIAVSDRNLRLQFGAQRYSQGGSNAFIKSDFEIRLSADGEVWSQPLDYNFGDVADVAGNWRLATADFTLPEGVTSLSIKFVAKVSSVNRLDDVLLIAGDGGQAIEFGKEDETATSTIAEVLSSPTDEIYQIEGTVVGTHSKGFLVKDDTGIILTFKKKHGMNIGDVITLKGATTEYGGMKQFGETSEVTKTGTVTVTQPEPEVFTAKEFEEYVGTLGIRYVTYSGVMTSTQGAYYQWYNNVAVEGTDIVGSISYPNSDLNIKNYEGKNITVTGYTIGVTGTDVKYINTMVLSIVEN